VADVQVSRRLRGEPSDNLADLSTLEHTIGPDRVIRVIVMIRVVKFIRVIQFFEGH
jgi:hypothetical protein